MFKKIKIGIGNLGVRLIKFTARKAKIDLLRLGYWENGIMKSHSFKASGELFLISQYLQQKIPKDAVIFDVGSNKGEYAALLIKYFPDARIIAFEPNPTTYQILNKSIGKQVQTVNCGIGSDEGILKLYFDRDNPTSVQASSDPEILKTIAKTDHLASEDIAIQTIDNYCESEGIVKIDFLKIDTEGFELEALIGAKKMLAKKAIGIIQFEFNEVNIVKRRFLKDFYDLLEEFHFYRLDNNRLISLEEWQPIHEIFMFQNIVAIQK